MDDARAEPGPLRRAAPFAALACATVLWAGHWVLGRGLHEDVEPGALGFWRWVVALCILIPLNARGLVRERRAILAAWRRLVVFAATGIAGFTVLSYIGLQHTTAINGALISTTAPVFVALLAYAGLGDRMTWKQLAGIGVALAGLLYVLAQGRLETLATVSFGRGDLFVIAAVFLWMLYSVLLRHWPLTVSGGPFLTAIGIVALILMLPVYLWEIAEGHRMAIDAGTVGSILYLGAGASVAALFCWNYGVTHLGAAVASLFQYLIPLVTSGIAVLFLGERVTTYHAIGLALIVAGITLVNRARVLPRKAKEAPIQP